MHAVLGGLAQAADDAHQPLRTKRDGSAGTRLSHQEHDGVPFQDGRFIRDRYQQERHDHTLRMRKLKAIGALALVCVGANCTTLSSGTSGAARSAATSTRWTDSVMASLTLREKAAQIVWPSVFGDYVSGDSPQWRRLTQYVQQEKVGGFTISVGSPIEVAAKLNALQAMSNIQLLVGADLEAGAGFRARD